MLTVYKSYLNKFLNMYIRLLKSNLILTSILKLIKHIIFFKFSKYLVHWKFKSDV